MIFKKKLKGSISLTLDESQFCTVWEGKQKECAYKFKVTTDATYYNLVFQDGKFFGQPLTNGGSIHPFAVDPRKQGSRRDKKKFENAKIICLSSQYVFNVDWGTPDFVMRDIKDKKEYFVGASGTLYAKLDPSDSQSAYKFYLSLLSHSDASKMTTTAVREKLRAAFENVIGAEIEKAIEEYGHSLSTLVALTPSEKLEISKLVYAKVCGVFSRFGCTLDKTANQNSIIGNLVVRPCTLVKPCDK